MGRALYLTVLLLAILGLAAPCPAQEERAGEEDETEVATSPKSAWGDFTIEEVDESESPLWSQILLWFPNRFLDLWDVFRVDLGVGPAVGGVIRLSKPAQLGYRTVAPFSFRVGDFGRRMPFLVETSNEFGIGPAYVNSKDRKVCKGEIGAGLDVFLVSGYAGFCAEELADFVAGIFFLDVMDDDYRG